MFRFSRIFPGKQELDGNGGDVSKAASISISLGSSKSQNNSSSASDTARGSSITAGGDVTISAVGAGQDSNITVQGSTINAGNNAKLLADNEIKLLAAKNDYTQTSSNSSSSGSIGISLGASTGVTLSASKARGNSDGTDTSYTNTFIQAGKTASLTSGGDTTLKGAVVAANQVKADVGGNLNIQSLQDTSTFTGQQSSSGASITIGPGFIPTGGGFSASKSNINSNFASVAQQSGIKAGDGGFQVKAAGNTDLKGGVIASTEAAVTLARNTFTTGSLSSSDIRNSASYQGKAVGISVDVGQQGGKFGVSGVGAGVGSDKGEASSVTTAGISGIAGNTAVRSTDAETGIQKIFDAAKVQREINAQVQITQAFSKEAPKATANYAQAKYDELKTTNPEEAQKWTEGGVYRVALHALTGALSGGVSGAVGAAASASAANLMNEFQDGIQKSLEDAGMSADAAKTIAQSLATVTAAGIGAAVGGAQGAATAATVDANNRQLHPSEEKWLREKAKEFARKEGITEEQALTRLTQQALKEVDYLWRAQLTDGDDSKAKDFLATPQTFTNDLGEQQKLFTTSGQQLFRPEMFADAANPAFYKQFAQSGMSRSLTDGLVKELRDSGIDLKNGAIDLAKAVKDNPAAALEGVWKAVKGLPQTVVDGFKETGTAIGEGSAIALDPELTAKLNAIYGTDTASAQRALLAIRLTVAVTGAASAAKAATGMTEATAKAVGKKLNDVLDQKAGEALIKSGGVFDKSGKPLLDLKQLTDIQKSTMGELFGENTVKKIVPDGQKLARMPGVGETGIDDLYKVSRPDVDYVNIEYKFVGGTNKSGSSALGNTADGRQGSQSWVTGSDRLEKAVGDSAALDVRLAIAAGRTETWVVRTYADGATEIQVLDALGKPKLIDTSKILISAKSLSGAQP